MLQHLFSQDRCASYQIKLPNALIGHQVITFNMYMITFGSFANALPGLCEAFHQPLLTQLPQHPANGGPTHRGTGPLQVGDGKGLAGIQGLDSQLHGPAFGPRRPVRLAHPRLKLAIGVDWGDEKRGRLGDLALW
jgi:hypothetical protein